MNCLECGHAREDHAGGSHRTYHFCEAENCDCQDFVVGVEYVSREYQSPPRETLGYAQMIDIVSPRPTTAVDSQ